MLTLSQTPYSSTAAFLNSAIDTIEHYGFKPADTSICKTTSKQRLRQARDIAYVLAHERKLTKLTRVCLENGMHLESDTKLLYNFEPNLKSVNSSSLGLHIVGAESTIAEITIISTINTLLKKLQIQNPIIRINSIGDRDSKTRFVRDLSLYMRSLSKDLPNYATKDMERKNPLLALVHLAEHKHPIVRNAPNPMEYLNDTSRLRLRTIFEYMENVGIDYELDPTLVGSSDCWTHTLFEILAPEEDVFVPIARGGRYNTLARRGFNRKLALVGAIIEYDIYGRNTPQKRKKVIPHFFISWLGDQARMCAFKVLEDFHNANIPIAKSIAHSHIGGQIEDSAKFKVSYLIIIGHKEALEGTVIIRNTTTRIQKIVPVTQLISYVSRLKV